MNEQLRQQQNGVMMQPYFLGSSCGLGMPRCSATARMFLPEKLWTSPQEKQGYSERTLNIKGKGGWRTSRVAKEFTATGKPGSGSAAVGLGDAASASSAVSPSPGARNRFCSMPCWLVYSSQ